MSHIKHSLERTDDIAVEGGTIHYRYYEPHDPDKAKNTPVIVIHGGPGGSHAVLYDYLEALANERPAIFYDQLGSHFSPAPISPDLLRPDRFVGELHNLINALNIKRVVLLGHSWGGGLAALYALQHPNHVEALILSGPLLSTNKWEKDCDALLAAFPQDIQDTIRRCEKNGKTNSKEYEKAIDAFSARHYCRLPDMPLGAQKHRKKTNREIYMAMWGPSELTCTGTLKSFDVLSRLHEIDVPVLILCGEYDTATPKTMEVARSVLKNAQLKVIPNSAHLPYLEQNEIYLSAVQTFLNTVSQGTAR